MFKDKSKGDNEDKKDLTDDLAKLQLIHPPFENKLISKEEEKDKTKDDRETQISSSMPIMGDSNDDNDKKKQKNLASDQINMLTPAEHEKYLRENPIRTAGTEGTKKEKDKNPNDLKELRSQYEQHTKSLETEKAESILEKIKKHPDYQTDKLNQLSLPDIEK